MEEKEGILRQFSQESSDDLYEAALTNEEKQELFSLEEAVISSFAAGIVSPTKTEEEIARAFESVQAGKAVDLSNWTAGDLSAVAGIAAAEALHKLAAHPVPNVLLELVKKPANAKKEAVPSFIVRLTNAGMKVVHSSLQGLASLPDAALATRSSIGHEPGVELAGTDGMHWQLVRESETLLHLGLQFPAQQPGDPSWSVQLRRDGRLIATQLVGDGATAANFGGLGAGSYEVDVMPTGRQPSLSARRIAFRVSDET